jgi:hypothetical protein
MDSYDLIWIEKYANKHLLVHRKTEEIVGYIEVYPKDGINDKYDSNYCYCTVMCNKHDRNTVKTFMSVSAGHRWLVSFADDLSVAPIPATLDYPKCPHPK